MLLYFSRIKTYEIVFLSLLAVKCSFSFSFLDNDCLYYKFNLKIHVQRTSTWLLIGRNFSLPLVVKISLGVQIDRGSQILLRHKESNRSFTSIVKYYKFHQRNIVPGARQTRKTSVLDYKRVNAAEKIAVSIWKCGKFGDASFRSRVRIVGVRTSPSCV